MTRDGLVMLVKQYAMELAPHNITFNGVAQTFVFTEMIRHVMEKSLNYASCWKLEFR